MDYVQIIKQFPWLITPNQKAIISYDADGWATALLLANTLNWKIVGYYDSETLIIDNKTKAEECIFVDVEIFRENIKSIGHHLIAFDNNKLPSLFSKKTQQCFNPNFVRGVDKKAYSKKYPFGTFHLLDKLLSVAGKNNYNFSSPQALSVIWFIDGLMNVRYAYEKNANSWINYLHLHTQTWLQQMNEQTPAQVTECALNFFNSLKKIADYNKIKRLSNFNVTTHNCLLQLISNQLGLNAMPQNFCTTNYRTINFTRYIEAIKTSEDFNRFWEKNPFSMSTYFGKKISFTTEEKNSLP